MSEFKCPNCGVSLEADGDVVGMEFTCPECGETNEIPAGEAEGPAVPKAKSLAGGPPQQKRDTGAILKETLEMDIDRGMTISQYMADKGVEGGVQLEDNDKEDSTVPAAVLETERGKKYEVGGIFAKGGMGAILNAKDLNVRRTVAMKVMLSDEEADNTDILRFIEEAQVTGQLEHPNIVPVHELGVDASGNAFYTMKKIKGITLQRIVQDIRKGKPETIKQYPLNRLLNIFLKVCDAVAFGNAKGVIHRDLKPENIMIGDYGEVLVLDWGLAKIVGMQEEVQEVPLDEEGRPAWLTEDIESVRQDDDSLKTMVGTIMGTPCYMAPEQAYGKINEMDTRTDIYALGGILYNILTLHTAVEGKTTNEVLLKVVQGEIPDPSTYNPKGKAPSGRALLTKDLTILHHCPGQRVPESLAAVAMKALALEQKNRYQSVKELQGEIEAYQAGFATSAEGAGLLRQACLLLKRHRKEAAMLAASLALLAAIVVGAFIGVNREKSRAVAAEKKAVELKNKFAYDAYLGHIAMAKARIDEHNFANARNLLAECQERYRNWEWGYLKWSCETELMSIAAHAGEALSVALSPDGRRLLSGGTDRKICVWDTKSGKQLLSLSASGEVNSVAFSPDGREIVSGASNGMLTVWQADTGRRLAQVKAHATGGLSMSEHGAFDGVAHIAITPDGKRIFSSGNGGCRVWRRGSGRLVLERKLATSAMGSSWMLTLGGGQRALLFSSKEGTPGLLEIVDPATGKQFFSMRHGDRTKSVAVSPDARLCLNTDISRFIHIRRLTDGRTVGRYPVPQFGIAAAFSPDSRRFAVGLVDNTIQVRDVKTGKLLLTLRGHSGAVASVTFSPDGRRVYSAGLDGKVKVWDALRDRSRVHIQGDLINAAFVPGQDRLLISEAAGRQTQLRLRSAASGKIIKEALIRTPVGAMALAADGRSVLLGGWNKTAIFRHLPDGRSHILKGHREASLNTVAISPDGKRGASRTKDGVIIVWDLEEGREIRRHQGHRQFLTMIAISPDGKLIAFGTEDNALTICDLASGKKVMKLVGHQRVVLGVAFAPDNSRIATGGKDGLIKIWDAATGKEQLSLRGHSGGVLRLVFGADGKRLLSASLDRSTKLWELTLGREILTLTRDSSWNNAVAWSPDGKRIYLSTGDGTAVILTAANWQ